MRFQVTWLPFGQHGFSKSARRTSTATWLSHGLQCLSFKQSATTMHNCAFKLPGCHLGSTGSVRAQDAQARLPGCRMVCSASVSSRVRQPCTTALSSYLAAIWAARVVAWFAVPQFQAECDNALSSYLAAIWAARVQ